MEVEKQVIAGRCGGRTLQESHHLLVVAVHEVDLEALDAHLAVGLAHLLHVAVEGHIARPEHEPHALLLGIVAQRGQVDFGHHLKQVGLLVHGPSLVENHILDAVAGGKVDIVLVGLVVDTCLEVHALQVPGIPPVPGHFAGFHPAVVAGGLLGQVAGHGLGEQVAVVAREQHHAPGQRALASHLGNVGLPLGGHALQHVVAALVLGLDHAWKPELHCCAPSGHHKGAGIVEHVVLAQQHLLAAVELDEHGRQPQVLAVEPRQVVVGVGVLKRAHGLLLERGGLAVARVGQGLIGLVVASQPELCNLVGDDERVAARGLYTVGHPHVVEAKHDAALRPLGGERVVGPRGLLGSFHALELAGVDGHRLAACQQQAGIDALHDGCPVVVNAVVYLAIGLGHGHFHFSVGRCGPVWLHRPGLGRGKQQAQQCCE